MDIVTLSLRIGTLGSLVSYMTFDILAVSHTCEMKSDPVSDCQDGCFLRAVKNVSPCS